jgi:ABC-type sugar transport system ATPase subunit
MTGPVSVAIPLDAAGDGAPVVAVRDLVKTFGTGDSAVDAVRHVSFDLAAGEILLVMGPSGSGKTTLLLMLGALLRPTAGSITVTGRAGAGAGIDIATAPERMLPRLRARAFGFVFQDYALLGALSAAENITVAANLAGVSGPPAAARASALLDRSGSPTGPPLARDSSPAVSSNASRSPAPWSTTHRCYLPTNPPPTSTPRMAATSPGCCATSPIMTGAASSSSATTIGSARSRTGCCGSRTVPSKNSPAALWTRCAACRSSAPGLTRPPSPM